MKRARFLILLAPIFFSSCMHSQSTGYATTELVGGCEGCEAIFEYGNTKLKSETILPGYADAEVKIKVTGTIYQMDGVTPAPDVILYVYHTDIHGKYSGGSSSSTWSRRHGMNRGWVKSDREGKYTFYTLKPAIYPERSTPAHIHPTILEPDGRYYFIEDYYFDDDALLSARDRNPDAPRGGTHGVLTLRQEGELLVGERDIVLGKNVPGY